MRHTAVPGYCIASIFLCFHRLIGLWKITLQIYTIGIGHRSVGPLRHNVRLPKGDAPVQEKLEPGSHGMGTGLHDNEAALGNGLQFVGGQQGSFHHLQALAGIVLATAHRAGEDGAATQSFGQDFCGLAVRSKAAEDGILAVILNDFAALFS